MGFSDHDFSPIPQFLLQILVCFKGLCESDFLVEDANAKADAEQVKHVLNETSPSSLWERSEIVFSVKPRPVVVPDSSELIMLVVWLLENKIYYLCVGFNYLPSQDEIMHSDDLVP